MEDVRWMDASQVAVTIAAGDLSPSEVLDATIDRIEAANPALNAVIIEWFEQAREVARHLTVSAETPLGGVPTLLKDLWADMAGAPLTNGNRALRDAGHTSVNDTTLVERYRRAGLVIAGRTNSPELGSLPVTEPLAYGPTRNPWNHDHTPGGSSGGAAAAVAAGLVPIAHASDGGGSIRIPAACCGLVGLKPSQGRITLGPARTESNLGVEHCVTRSVRDSALMLDISAGPGIGDSVIAPAPGLTYADEVGADPGVLRIGVLDHDPRGGTIDPVCADAATDAAALLASLGHHVDTSWPDSLADESMSTRFMAQWATNMAVGIAAMGRSLGRELTEDEVEPVNWAMAEFAKNFSAVDLAESQAAVADFRRRTLAWWAAGWDLLITPTVGQAPPRIGEHLATEADPMVGMRRSAEWVVFTGQFNMTGQPAISLPLAWTADGLPIGVQLVAAYGREDLLIRVASQLEAAQPWAHRHPT
jgi:amidase